MFRLAVLSPHLDDAVIGCADHLLALDRRDVELTVINVFNSCGSGDYSLSGVLPPEASSSPVHVKGYEAERREEDRKALEILGAMPVYLNFVDAAFRGDYTRVSELFSGSLGELEGRLVDEVVAALAPLGPFDGVLVPMGVGKHVDHLVVRTAARGASIAPRIGYYVEFPYALRPWNWQWGLLREMMAMKKSLQSQSARKRQLLGCYRSQMSMLSGSLAFCPEIILTADGWLTTRLRGAIA